MTTFAILATGPSLTQEIVDKVRGRCGAIAVSDAYRLAPWADALVSQDKAWWRHHPEALEFAGRKFIGVPPDTIRGVEQADRVGAITSGTNSGLLGCHVAVTVFKATRILLLGLDLQGNHFFGRHPEPLKNTKPERFAVMRKQFEQWPHKGVQVINCTLNSSLRCFPFGDLDACLAEPSERFALSA